MPNITVIDRVTAAILQKEVENGTYSASCGHKVPIDMLLVAIKQFMVSCMKIAMGKELKNKFKGWYASHRFIFVNALDMIGCRTGLSYMKIDTDRYVKQRGQANLLLENTRYSLYNNHRILICAPFDLSEIPYSAVALSSRFCALDDVQLFYLGRFITKMVARLLCSHARWLKEPAQGTKIAEKVEYTLLHYRYDATLDFCENMWDVVFFGPDWV